MKEKQISTSWIKLVKDFIYQRHTSPLTIRVPYQWQFKTRNGTLNRRSSRADSFLPMPHSPGQKIVGSFHELHPFSFAILRIRG